MLRAYNLCRLVAIHFRHLAVHQDRVIIQFSQNFDYLTAVVNDISMKSKFLLQYAQSNLLINDIILSQQYANMLLAFL